MGKFGYLNYKNSENQITHANNDDFDEFLESTIMEGEKKKIYKNDHNTFAFFLIWPPSFFNQH